MIRAVVFDLDDTLFAEREFVISGFRAVGDWVEKAYFLPGFFAGAKQLFEEGQRGKIFDKTLKNLGLEPKPALIDNMLRIYREHKPDISLHQDAKWVLGYLQDSRKLGIITDGYIATQRNKIAALKIQQLFQTIIYSDEYGRDNWKPSSLPYIKIMERLGCKGDECAYIGDNPAKDFIAAKKLSWRAIQICRKNSEYIGAAAPKSYAADCRIASLYELINLV